MLVKGATGGHHGAWILIIPNRLFYNIKMHSLLKYAKLSLFQTQVDYPSINIRSQRVNGVFILARRQNSKEPTVQWPHGRGIGCLLVIGLSVFMNTAWLSLGRCGFDFECVIFTCRPIGAIAFLSIICNTVAFRYIMTSSNGNIFSVTGPLWG